MISVITNVVLVLHILIAIALTGAVLLQRSEGGALGMGGGGAGGGLMSGRGAAGALARTTMFLAIGFFATSLALTTIANRTQSGGSAVESETGETGPSLDEDEDIRFRPIAPGTLDAEDGGTPEAQPETTEDTSASPEVAPGDINLDLDGEDTPEDESPN